MRIIVRSFATAIAVIVMALSSHAQDVVFSEMTVAEVVAALDSSDLSASELRSMASYQRLEIVDLAKLENEPDYDEVEKALDRMDDGWARVQTAIVGNDLIREALREQKVSIQKVTAASDANGVVTIYVR